MIQIEGDVVVKNLSWYDIVSVLNTKDFKSKKIVENFISFAERNYKMNNINTKVCSGCNCRSDAGSDIVRNFCLYK